jgi:ATP-dependent protease HslVU (ClpYQ) peptidase subunit
MSTVVVVRKDDLAVIAADTLTIFGSTKESAEYVKNYGKSIKYKENYLGVSGSASLQIALEDFLLAKKKTVFLKNIREIYRFGLSLHKELKDKHFLRADDDESFETFRGDILIINSSGIFGLSSYRYVQEFTKFYANGSGSEYALGAMFAIYHDADKTAVEIAETAVKAGAEFDDSSGLPIESFTIKLK